MVASSERYVEVTYRGLAVAREARLADFAGDSAFLEIAEPLPAGTELGITSDAGHTFRVKVVSVREEVGGRDGAPGMRVKVLEMSGPGQAWWRRAADRCADSPGGE